MSTSLDWSFDIRRNKDGKAVKIIGICHLGGRDIRVVVKPDGVTVNTNGTVRTDSEHWTQLASVVADLTKELNE